MEDIMKDWRSSFDEQFPWIVRTDIKELKDFIEALLKETALKCKAIGQRTIRNTDDWRSFANEIETEFGITIKDISDGEIYAKISWLDDVKDKVRKETEQRVAREILNETNKVSYGNVLTKAVFDILDKYKGVE
jgi:hypothetical protein